MPAFRLLRWIFPALLLLALACPASAQDPVNPDDPDAYVPEEGVTSNPTTSFSEPIPAIPSDIDLNSPAAMSAQFQRWWWAYSVRTNVGTGQPADSPTQPLVTASNVMNANVAIPPSGGLPGTRWMLLGPQPHFTTVNNAGRITSIAVDPTNASHWLIGGAQGGIWETLDSGANWVAKTDNTASLATGAVAFAPSNPRIIYVGTCEGSFSGDSYAGRGVLKSTDGGTNWNLLATSTFEKSSFTRLRVHPTNPNILWASTITGVAGLTLANNDGTPAPPRGVFKSTDGGVTWTAKLPGTGATDLALKPGDTTGMNMYAALGARTGPPENGIYRSTDGGETWTLVTGPWTSNPALKGRAAIAIAPSNPNIMYASMENSANANVLGVWKTTNAWDTVPTWTQLPNTTFCNGQCWYDQEIQVDPTDPLILYLGGVNLFRFNGSTTNTYTNIITNGIHVDQHATVFAGSRMIQGNDGGVWSSTNRGANWTSHNATLTTSQYYHGSLPPGNETFAGTTTIPAGPGLIIGGAQDNGTHLYRGVLQWRNIGGGDGVDNKISPANPTTKWAISSQNNAIQRTLNGGQNFSSATSGLSGAPNTFMTRFEECKWNENVFISASALHLFRTNGFFNTTFSPWAAQPVTLNGSPVTFDSGIMSMTFATADTTCSTYVFSSRSATTIPYTTDGGATWKDYRSGNPNLPTRTPTDFAFHPTDSNTLYVTFSGFNTNTPATPGHVFKSTNAMSANPTFTDISPTAVDIPFNTVAIDPTSPNVIYVGSDVGIWRSSDAGATWVQMGDNNSGLPNVAVFEIQASPTQIVAFTHGRGAYRLAGYDLNNDNTVNCADYAIVRAALNSRIGQPAYNALADLNNDNQVNIRDLTMMSKQLPAGTVCP